MSPISPKNPLLLIILDGLGLSMEKKGNALLAAKIPNMRYISEWYPGATLQASGAEVGLMWGEMGSSEVGHANIGAGLVVCQNLPRINMSIKDKSFLKIPVWKKAVDHATKNNSSIHVMGLVSNGGVHSHIGHLFAVLETIKELGFNGQVFVHVFIDGRDAAPKSAMKFIEPLEKELKTLNMGQIATLAGRFYAMDRAENWDRTEKAYRCMTEGAGIKAASAEKAVEDSYAKNQTDETAEPYNIVDKNNQPLGLIKDNDAAIFFNFRADRTRQLTAAFTSDNFNKFQRKKIQNLYFATMTQYGPGLPMEMAFSTECVSRPLAYVLSKAGKKQLHIAETEKYAHVTYFFNGGNEVQFPNEDRITIPSKSVKSYDLAPEMSTYEIADRVMAELKNQKYDFIVANFANSDMVGHTGDLKATSRGIEVIDECIGKLFKETLDMGGVMIVTADHGNGEETINIKTGEIDKEHSTNPVPFWLVTPDNKKKEKTGKRTNISPNGLLGDVAPTILDLMGLPNPEEMTGTSLLNVITDCPLPEK